MGGSKNSKESRNIDIRKAGGRLSRRVLALLRFVLTVLSLGIVAYVVFALVYSTNTEKALIQQNEEYALLYPELPAKLALIGEDMDRLAKKDDIIYKDIFHAEPPQDDPMSSLGIFFGSDSIPDSKLVFYTARKADRLVEDAARVDSLFRTIVDCLKQEGFIMPPMELPLKNLNYTQTGAGVGTKINPFYTTVSHHEGVDFIVPQGTDVLAPAAAVVSNVTNSRKGGGNTVTLTHKGGYKTYYAHLSEIFVSQGQSVKKGARIAVSGMSGNSYAPHLHYEMSRDTTRLDPLIYVFASVSPEDYTNMVFMAQHTKQSMD